MRGKSVAGGTDLRVTVVCMMSEATRVAERGTGLRVPGTNGIHPHQSYRQPRLVLLMTEVRDFLKI